MGTETHGSEGTEHDAKKKKESILLLTTLWDACILVQSNVTAAPHKRRLWRTTKAARLQHG